MAKITKIEVQKKNKERVNLFLDEEYAFSLSIELIYKEGLKKNDEVDSQKLEALAEKESLIRCKNSALRIIEKSHKTEKEVIEKLKSKGYGDNAINKSIEFLKEYNFINDLNYAKAFINDKLNSVGSQKIRYTLLQKGISKELVEEHLSNSNKENEKNVAFNLAKKKVDLLRKKENDNYKISGKLYRYLISKGYEYDITNEVVKQVMSLDDFE
ncbi:regulatory protein RecX [Clostridium puniceum]|uniref:Regulatory protein RecX n=1 Tax=Clostridium puniceum TaxID=29367 RepID=A0A1S8TP53_9CLOT|nr:recombination regulator RecX [Clostridium puniceum]OOM79557.1 regulatory protein RecX [Clostridium puniceum]